MPTFCEDSVGVFFVNEGKEVRIFPGVEGYAYTTHGGHPSVMIVRAPGCCKHRRSTSIRWMNYTTEHRRNPHTYEVNQPTEVAKTEPLPLMRTDPHRRRTGSPSS